MKKKLKYLGLLLLIALVVIQFFPPEENANPAFSGHRMHDAYNVPEEVNIIFKESCMDCHSNNTKAMWYMNVQPVGWWIADHVEEGRAELNFDEFAKFPLAKQYHKFEEIEEMINEGEMPLSSYKIMHDYAELTETEKKAVIEWTTEMRGWMKETYPADSLIRK